MADQLRAFADLSEDMTSFSSIHVCQLTTLYDSSSRGSEALSSSMSCIPTYTPTVIHAQTYTLFLK